MPHRQIYHVFDMYGELVFTKKVKTWNKFLDQALINIVDEILQLKHLGFSINISIDFAEEFYGFCKKMGSKYDLSEDLLYTSITPFIWNRIISPSQK